MRFLLLTMGFALANSAIAGADCSKVEPEKVAQRFYEHHKTFYWKEAPTTKGLVTPALHRALLLHYRCQDKGDQCHFDYNPWTGAQDGDISRTQKYVAETTGPNTVSVTMHYKFELSGHPDVDKKVVLKLKAAAPPRCWRVDDLITPTGESLVARYNGPP